MGKFSGEVMEEHLSRALRTPTDKLAGNWNTDAATSALLDAMGSNGKAHVNSTATGLLAAYTAMQSRAKLSGSYLASLFPSGRFRDDYIFSGKFLSPLNTVGFSVNPEHCNSVRWSHVFANIPMAKLSVILYYRTNVVKMAVSAHVGQQVKARCGSANLRSGHKCEGVNSTSYSTSNTNMVSSSATGPVQQVDWFPGEFCHRFNQWSTRQAKFFKTVHDSVLPAMRTGHEHDQLQETYAPHVRGLHGVSYEELQLDFNSTGQSVLTRLQQLTQQPTFSEVSSSASNTKEVKSEWVKRNSEDLSLILTHYSAILKRTQDPSCNALRSQLTSVVPEIFPLQHIDITNCDISTANIINGMDSDPWICSVTPLSITL